MRAHTARLSSATRYAVLALLLLLGAAWQNGAAAANIVIESPGSEETVHDNLGQVTVSVKVESADRASTPFAFQAMVDGKPFGGVQRSPTFKLEGMERGEHTLRVQLLDSSGNLLAESQAVKFYMWQASRLFPSRM